MYHKQESRSKIHHLQNYNEYVSMFIFGCAWAHPNINIDTDSTGTNQTPTYSIRFFKIT